MSTKRLRNLLPFLLFFLALLGFVLYRVGWLAPVEGVAVRITAPIQEAITSVVERTGGLSQTARDLRDLRQRNQDLESENAGLFLENVRLREVLVEATLCRDLLEFAQAQPAFSLVGAHVTGRVIGEDPSNLQRFLLLDVGRESGITRNMPVVTDRGLVGRISEVGPGWSRVLLITDVSSSINALTQSTRASGLVQGQPGGSLLMRAIPQADAVSVGDTVFTSGLGGDLPRQILIGQVTAVARRDTDLYQTAIVKPTVDLYHLESVLVVTDFGQ
jgi:rod shape-determining protein MreC